MNDSKLVTALSNNQFVVHCDDVSVFQSYNTTMAVSDFVARKVYVRDSFKSTTTSKWVNVYLRDWVASDWEIVRLTEVKFEAQLRKLRKTKLFR